jgi:EamA domain-containing membrane protein RarD
MEEGFEMNEMGLFGVSFVFVFALSFQQQNIHHRRYLFALINAAFIAALNLFVVRLGAQASPTEIFAFIAGQPLGTVAAMWLNSHPLTRKLQSSQSPTFDQERHG